MLDAIVDVLWNVSWKHGVNGRGVSERTVS